jgi:cupin fold WbuC family metalloprotein
MAFSPMKQITRVDLVELAAQASQAPRLRANRNLHPELQDPVQRLAIAMEPGTYVRVHRHPHTFELLTPLNGRFVVLNFDDQGQVTARTILGEDSAVLETPANTWHAVLSLDVSGVIFEVKQGAYQPVAAEDYWPGSPAEGEAGTEQVMAWYEVAQVGDSLAFLN